MKLVRVLSRIVLLSLVAGAFVGLTGLYGGSVRTPLPNPRWREGRRHRPSGPQVSQFPSLVGEGIVLALCAMAGRIAFRLRLSPVPRSEEQPILLNLYPERPGPQRD